jgi:hypothetical protein
MTDYQKEIIDNPKKYTGIAQKRTDYIINKWNKYFKEER